MITYKLAKKLKDAGFSQENITTSREGDSISYVDSGKVTSKDYISISAFDYEKKRDRCYIPTLPELIEACGDEFQILTNFGVWKAGYANMDGALHESKPFGSGSTPEEAVANLYIALHSHGIIKPLDN